MNVNAIVLAAGKGLRMMSDLPKCAHEINGKPMIEYVIDSLEKVCSKDIIVVVGHRKEVIEQILQQRTKFAHQREQLGTGNAVLMAEEHIKDRDGVVIVAVGDMPLISVDTYRKLLETHSDQEASITLLTALHPCPKGYGRVIRAGDNSIVGIVEEKDCEDRQRMVHEVNASVYIVDAKILFVLAKELKRDNSQGEFYFTDIVKIARAKGLKIASCTVDNYMEVKGINDRAQLAEVQTIMQHLEKL